ncbi:MAG: acyl carrier protein [Polyangiales bacterium]
MTRDEIFAKVRATLVDNFEIPAERVTDDARLMEDLELDSIDAIDMAVQIQEMTGVRVEEDDLKKLRTVGDTVQLVAALLARAP